LLVYAQTSADTAIIRSEKMCDLVSAFSTAWALPLNTTRTAYFAFPFQKEKLMATPFRWVTVGIVLAAAIGIGEVAGLPFANAGCPRLFRFFQARRPAVTAQDTKGAKKNPDAVDPPKGHVLIFELRAEGFQVYECKPVKGRADEFEWVLKVPDAILYDEKGEKAGTHFDGPTWQATDGSKVVAAISSSIGSPGGKAIPWLLLKAKSHEGNGAFSNVTYIQRLDTWAGLAPTKGATKENVGTSIRVRYQATYRFFRSSQDKVTEGNMRTP
jgi:hypothetical protein